MAEAIVQVYDDSLLELAAIVFGPTLLLSQRLLHLLETLVLQGFTLEVASLLRWLHS